MAKKEAAKKSVEVEEPVTKRKNNKTVEIKVSGKSEIIQLQKDGKLVGYDPATGIAIVREEGLGVIWPV